MINRACKFGLNLTLGFLGVNLGGGWALTAGTPYLLGFVVLSVGIWGLSCLVDDWLADHLNVEINQLRAWQITAGIVLFCGAIAVLCIG